MSETFEQMLSGGHHNSLGRTEEVTALVLEDRSRFVDLIDTYSSKDELVRLRVSGAVKRVTIAHPDWATDHMDRLQSEVAAIDQASTQWTLALIFNLTKHLMNDTQKKRAIDIMKHNLADHPDWIVLNNSMQVLFEWSSDDPALAAWLKPHLERLTSETRKSVSGRARKLLAKLG